MTNPRTPSRNTTNLNSPSKGPGGANPTLSLTFRPAPSTSTVKGKTVRRVALHPSMYGQVLGLSATGLHGALIELSVGEYAPVCIAAANYGAQSLDTRTVQVPPSVAEDLKASTRDLGISLDVGEKSKSVIMVKKHTGRVGMAAVVEVEDHLCQIPVKDSEGWRHSLENSLCRLS